MFAPFVNLEGPEKRYANTGQASANVYINGPQYEEDTPVIPKNTNSTILSTTK